VQSVPVPSVANQSATMNINYVKASNTHNITWLSSPYNVNKTTNEPILMKCNSQHTFTLKTLFHQAEQHLTAEVTEMRRLVRVDMKNVRTNLQFFHCSACCQQHKHTQTAFYIISLQLLLPFHWYLPKTSIIFGNLSEVFKT